ncbi:MAG: hypothetical protein LBE06_03875 [Azoarcus sp.]|jgi:hypothetical protein|nr:hypothetical protein [Azoarcus sp.]
MKHEKHREAVPVEVVRQISMKIDECAALLQPHLLGLSPKARQALGKMGDKSLAFVAKVHEYAHGNPRLVPAFSEVEAFDADYQDATGLQEIDQKIAQLKRGVEDIVMQAGAEAMEFARLFYLNAQTASRANVPMAVPIVNDLKERFPYNKRHRQASENGDREPDA